MADPKDSLRVFFNSENVQKLRGWMKKDHITSSMVQKFVIDRLEPIMDFLEKSGMTFKELMILLEKGPHYVKTLQKTKLSNEFKELHFIFAGAWEKW